MGPADTPFARSAVARGLVGGDAASLVDALEEMRADGVDSDGDGAEDLDELSWEGDPNHADLPEAGRLQTVTYGCAWSGGAGGGWAAAAAIAALIGIVSRRRRA